MLIYSVLQTNVCMYVSDKCEGCNGWRQYYSDSQIPLGNISHKARADLHMMDNVSFVLIQFIFLWKCYHCLFSITLFHFCCISKPKYWFYIERVPYKIKWAGCKIVIQQLHNWVISIYVVIMYWSHGNNEFQSKQIITTHLFV